MIRMIRSSSLLLAVLGAASACASRPSSPAPGARHPAKAGSDVVQTAWHDFRVVEVADGHHHAVVRAVWREGRRVF
jgi:hypothetical protein